MRDGTEIGRPRDGALIGEMSFVQGGKTPASVWSRLPSHAGVFFGQTELRHCSGETRNRRRS